MEIFIAALLLVGISVIGLCFNIIFRKNGRFPDTEISSNPAMRKLGIRCAKEETAQDAESLLKLRRERNESCRHRGKAERG